MFRKGAFRSAVVSAELPNTTSLAQKQEAIDSKPATQSSIFFLPFRRLHRRSQSQRSTPTTKHALLPSGNVPKAGPDPFGLQAVYEPEVSSGDIVFVHGLGGTAWRTWSWERETANFWPRWLSEDVEFSSVRMWTFGYNANFKGAATNLNIKDFAKDLLLQLSSAFAGSGQDGPIIFVAHSMGGLVVKQAYLLGKADKHFSQLIDKVFGIAFLATPHGGAQYARLLNNVLSAAPIAGHPKLYVAELEKQSGSIQDINEKFGQDCEDLALISFYETLRTNLGFTKALIVDKDSAILGYENEVSAPMDADHHTICKFKDRQDSNFLKLRGVLKSWVLRHINPDQLDHPTSRTRNAKVVIKVQAILGVHDAAETEDNLIAMGNLLASGSGEWLNEKRGFLSWAESQPPMLSTRFFWLIGFPGAGKTSLAARVVERLQTLGQYVQYHFFSLAHQTRRTSAYCLRSIATQLALSNEAFRSALIKLHEGTGISFNSQSQNFQTIWERIFVGIIFQIPFPQPLTWVLDGIDEADTPSLLLSHLSKIPSHIPIRGSDTSEDVRIYTQNAVRNAIPENPILQKHVIDQIMENSSGSFLWVKLALETLQESWHTQKDIQVTLSEVPSGMAAMYNRMLEPIKSSNPRTQELATRIVSWAACCWRPLFIDELREGLEPEFGTFTNLTATITQLCGNFITVDQSSSVEPRMSLIHATAREFLLSDNEGYSPFVDAEKAHEYMAITCLSYLSNFRWQRHFSSVRTSARMLPEKGKASDLVFANQKGCSLLGYASCYWAYHVSNSPVDAPGLLKAMDTFFSNHCLYWIEGIALSGDLQYLSRAAKYLKLYVKRGTGKSRTAGPDAALPLKDAQEGFGWIQAWTVDIVGIQSMVGRAFGTHPSGSLTVEGLPSTTWDDCLANVDVGGGADASQVLATETLFIALISPSGIVTVWSAEACEKLKTIRQGEYVTKMVLNSSGTLLATSGYHGVVLDFAFGREDSELLVGLDNCAIIFYSLKSGKSQNDSILYPDQLKWRQETGSLMILCNNTKLVEWRIFDNEQVEYDHINARDIAISDNAEFLLSSDTQGTIKIWAFPKLDLIYSLLNPKENESCQDLVFSPNCQRFYDIRGSVCNVWEPSALIHPDEYDLNPSSSAGSSALTAEPIIASTGSTQTLITAMAVSSSDKYFCCGREDGSVIIADAFDGKKLRKAYGHTCSTEVVELSWSNSGKYMVSCDEYGRVICKRLQFLFSKDEKFLLVSTMSEDRVWNLKAKKETHVRKWGPYQARRWVQHPTKFHELIWVEPSQLRTFKWSSFEVVDVVRIPSHPTDRSASREGGEKSSSRSASPSGHPQKMVQWATTLHTEHGQYLVYAALRGGNGNDLAACLSQFGLEVEVLKIADFLTDPPQGGRDAPTDPVSEDAKTTIPTTAHMPASLAEHVKFLVGVQGCNLVFLDHEGWLCTWDVLAATARGGGGGVPSPTTGATGSSGDEQQSDREHPAVESDDEDVAGLKRHFFTPKDWLNTNTSHLAIVNGHGALLCPRYGDVAIVRNGMQL
ncbi:hypothetical protein QBC33DRAFT_594654 [Phialemonium atrogriseum]|uniref:GPI inositol-deacylase n=1 Tax=Phialemonium atrogriseum TaxID=1093897 RepID=A0AAJ0BU86_9PEZI|nr:uncharacterized protein QBC33DRAFT_594654 [Phialemonium atrogriseum]KAK1764603.1 hypothetical protein QBC33DRAFT_594654 [Phialemonium atrogriseum]